MKLLYCVLVVLSEAAHAHVALRAKMEEVSSSPANKTAAQSSERMVISPSKFVEVSLGPFQDAEAACSYCFDSFTKKGDPPAGPVAPFCVCMAYPETKGGSEYNMFCATPPSAAEYVKEKGGCVCKENDQENMGRDTCNPI